MSLRAVRLLLAGIGRSKVSANDRCRVKARNLNDFGGRLALPRRAIVDYSSICEVDTGSELRGATFSHSFDRERTLAPSSPCLSLVLRRVRLCPVELAKVAVCMLAGKGVRATVIRERGTGLGE